MAMWMILLVAPPQLVVGDLHGLNTVAHQPAKIAAIEGLFETHRGAPLLLFGIPDMEAETTRYAVEIPKLGSLILTHDSDGLVRGLKEWPRSERPNATIVFWTFRIMVGLGLLMIALALIGAFLRWKGRLFDSRLFLRGVVLMGPSGLIALLAGWITTEVGRQPWTVYGLLTTAESASPVGAPGVAASLAAFVAVYLVVFGAGAVYLLRLLGEAPDDKVPHPGGPGGG
jgi:cytochrome d ubiquinol oxidase subunit I